MSKRKIYTQISLDVTNIPEALELAKGAVKAGVDWIEAGTPLILGEGLHSVKALREYFPDHPIVADLKTMDGAGLEAEMMLKAGATHVVIMSQAHWASVKEIVKMARSFGAKVMADVLNAPDKPLAAKAMQDLGADWIIVYTGYDERRYVENVSPLKDLPTVLEAVGIPVQAVGGLTLEQSMETVRMGASSLVIGAPLAIQADCFAASDEYERILSEVVRQVREMTQ